MSNIMKYHRLIGLALLTAWFMGCATPEPCLKRGGRGQGFRCQEAAPAAKLPPMATPKLYQYPSFII